jgi:tetratricopeptide (TPR) repeat protein
MRGALARALSSNAFLVAALVLAAALRVGHLVALARLPLFDSLILDSETYDAWARRIAAGDWMGGERAFYMDPLYPYLLAAVYAAVGRDLLVVRLLQAALGVATCGLAAAIGRRVGGSAVGNLAALLLALYGPAIFQEAEIEKTALGVFLATGAIALVLRDSVASRLGAGAAFALAALARANLLLLLPLFPLYVLAVPTAPSVAAGVSPAGAGWRRVLGRPGGGAVAFLAGCLAVLAPVAWRNHHVAGEWILTTSQAGPNFYTGNNPANRVGTFMYVPFVRPHPAHEEDDFRAAAEARAGRALGPREVSSFWFGEAWRHIRERPGEAALVTLRKFVLFWSDFEMPDAWDMYFLARYSPVLRLPLLGMASVLALAAVGAWAGFRRGRHQQFLVAYVLLYSASVVAFFIFSRYRMHVVPVLCVFAAAAVPWLGERAAARDARRLLAAALAAGVVAAFSLFAASLFGVRPRENIQSFMNLAWLYQQRGEYRQAEALLAEALAKEGGAGKAGPLCALGSLREGAGDLAGAVPFYRECARASPLFPDVWARLGQALEKTGTVDGAREAYQTQLRVVPGHEGARRGLGRLEGEVNP